MLLIAVAIALSERRRLRRSRECMLAVGAHADLLVVDGNPLEDIGILTRPERNLRHVVKSGAVI